MAADEPRVTVALELDDAGNLEASCSACGHQGFVPPDEAGPFLKGAASHLQLHAKILALGTPELLRLVGRG